MQIGLDRVVESNNDDHKDGAAEPRKIVVQERPRLHNTIRREPVLLIRNIDQLWHIAEIIRGMTNPIIAARKLTPTKTVKKSGFVCQPFATSRPFKCEATTSGSCE